MDRARLDGEATFCMDFGQIRTGDDNDETYLKMLQQVTRVTESVAGGIADQYPNVASLMTAFKQHGPRALEDLTVSTCNFSFFTFRLSRARNGTMRMDRGQSPEWAQRSVEGCTTSLWVLTRKGTRCEYANPVV